MQAPSAAPRSSQVPLTPNSRCAAGLASSNTISALTASMGSPVNRQAALRQRASAAVLSVIRGATFRTVSGSRESPLNYAHTRI